MRSNSRKSHSASVKCCAVCGGKFGLIRHYWWRTALCSRICVDRFDARREADHKWLRFASRLAPISEQEAEFQRKFVEHRA